MRELNFNDVFVFARVLQTIGAKNILREYAAKADTLDDVFEGGFLFVWDLFEAASKTNSQSAIFAFLADIFGCESDEVGLWSISQIESNLKQLAEQNDLKGFFKRAAALMK